MYNVHIRPIWPTTVTSKPSIADGAELGRDGGEGRNIIMNRYIITYQSRDNYRSFGIVCKLSVKFRSSNPARPLCVCVCVCGWISLGKPVERFGVSYLGNKLINRFFISRMGWLFRYCLSGGFINNRGIMRRCFFAPGVGVRMCDCWRLNLLVKIGDW